MAPTGNPACGTPCRSTRTNSVSPPCSAVGSRSGTSSSSRPSGRFQILSAIHLTFDSRRGDAHERHRVLRVGFRPLLLVAERLPGRANAGVGIDLVEILVDELRRENECLRLELDSDRCDASRRRRPCVLQRPRSRRRPRKRSDHPALPNDGVTHAPWLDREIIDRKGFPAREIQPERRSHAADVRRRHEPGVVRRGSRDDEEGEGDCAQHRGRASRDVSREEVFGVSCQPF